LQEEDIAGSGFAITGYTVHQALGGDSALARLRERLRKRGLKLLLDFVPNHTGLDHPWVEAHPEYYIPGTESDLEGAPQNYTWAKRQGGDLILAYGRDPYFPGWPDTLQLDYSNPSTQKAMTGELLKIAGQCDGVRCDMAMLVLPDIFARTWGISTAPFWPRATAKVNAEFPGFIFLAEVYWDLEWTLQQQGFDYTYDKRLYDRLKQGVARPAREHLLAGLDFQDHLARFLENHDEPRVAETFTPDVHRAAAVVTFFTPGMRFLHQGQRQGKKIHIPVHLRRGPVEAIDASIALFYDDLLGCLKDPAFRDGQWQLLDAQPAWEGNQSNDAYLAFSWTGPGNLRRLVVVNYAAHQSQGYIKLPWVDLSGRTWRFSDRLSQAVYDRNGDDLSSHGLYLDMPGWGYHIFDVVTV
jgi:Alpha amylase, catalytic domain